MYSKYATNHDQAQKLFEELKKNRKEFVNFLEVSQKDPACQGLSLDAFLIKPVQRYLFIFYVFIYLNLFISLFFILFYFFYFF